MGPLIPQNIIPGDLNFFYAFLIGLAFGFILEQAGFSSSRKLAGVFYGYDFVVLKVFFTAGVTAATGIFFFQYLGWIDMDFVFVNPLFVKSALIGGVIMGFGFILGGFCPGTSFAAAVTGKFDAIIFILGIFIGVLLFGLGFDFFEPLYNANPQGREFIFDSLGISRQLFLFLLIIVALTTFAITQKIQNKASRFKELLFTQTLKVKYPAIFLLILALTALFLPAQRSADFRETSGEKMIQAMQGTQKHIPPQKVAHFLIHDTKDIYLVDVRSKEEYTRFHLPGAVHLPLENILSKTHHHMLQQNNRKTVFYSNGDVKASAAWFFAQRSGISDFYLLEGGLNHFYSVFFSDKQKDIEKRNIMKSGNKRFIEFARKFFSEGEIYERKGQGSEVPEIKETEFEPAQGGC
ncbi:MAG: YeeE/YedE thiosulfate transporter family protein [Bacteroidales bacterium]